MILAEENNKNTMGLRGRSLFKNQGVVSFVTTTVMHFQNVFSISESYYEILVNSLKFVLRKYDSALIAYVLMPNHIHLILSIASTKILSSFMRDFKRHTSVKIRDQLILDERFELIERFKYYSRYDAKSGFKFWQERFDDFILYNEKTLEIKINYIHNNPVKKGLVKNPEDWKYSSYRNYFHCDNSVIEISCV